jgi:hypothetical protein
MSAKRLAALVVPVLVLVSSALAQGAYSGAGVNEVSVTAGRTFVSTQTVPGTGAQIHFGNPVSVAFNYSRELKTYKIFGLFAELPVVLVLRMNLNYPVNVIPKDIGALFVTPSVRFSAFSGEAVSPWVSAGGGYGRFREAPSTIFGGPNPGSDGTNTGVLQLGAGLDVFPWERWGARFEARDFYSGVPSLNVDTGRSRQHNYYVGAGVIYRF